MEGINTEEILSHNLFDKSILFDFATTTKTNKSVVVTEIEKGLFSITAITEFKKDLTFHSRNS